MFVVVFVVVVVVAFGVAGATRESEIGRMAIMELGVPDVFVIDQQHPELAMRNVRHGATTVIDRGNLHTVVGIQIRRIVLQQENDCLMAGLVVNGQVLAIIGARVSCGQNAADGKSGKDCSDFHGVSPR